MTRAEAQQLADSIEAQLKSKKNSLFDELTNNQYKFSRLTNGSKEELILNADVIGETSMTTTTSSVIIPNRVQGVSKPAYPNSIIPYLNVQSSTSSFLSWIEQSSQTEAADTRTEGDVFTQGDRAYTEHSLKSITVSGFMDVTEGSLKDVNFLNSELQNGVVRDVQNKLNSQIINGDGIAPNMVGLLEMATPFNAGNLVGLGFTLGPTYADVLKVANNQIMGNNYNATLAILNPEDYTRMQLGSNATYSLPFNVIASTHVPLDTYLILDGSLVNLYIVDQFIKLSPQNADNALYERVSVIGQTRAILKVATVNYTGIVKGTFSDDIVTISTSPVSS